MSDKGHILQTIAAMILELDRRNFREFRSELLVPAEQSVTLALNETGFIGEEDELEHWAIRALRLVNLHQSPARRIPIDNDASDGINLFLMLERLLNWPVDFPGEELSIEFPKDEMVLFVGLEGGECWDVCKTEIWRDYALWRIRWGK